jgi:SSS family solute:Na+ symporter
MLPTGLRALLFAALLAAAMSSLDSALNSLSASTMRDFVSKWKQDSDQIHLGKITTVIWGILVTGFAFIVGGISDTVIEAINKIGSAFYGPILAAFLVGILTRKVTTRTMFIGIIVGVGFNITLWLTSANIYWMWWNLFGCVLTGFTAWILSISNTTLSPEKYHITFQGLLEREQAWTSRYLFLIGYFLAILAVVLIL